ncbi:MAG: phenylalanine--tRNA ligase subunit beta [Nitrososphaerota archaeon]
MPILLVKKERFWQLLGKRLSDLELSNLLHNLGMDVEEVSTEFFRVEYNPNRPDYSSLSGITRAARGLLGIEVGFPKYRLTPPKTYVKVDPNVENIRPYIVGAIVRGFNLDSDKIEELITMQEDLHWILGRDRRKVAIGLHNLDVLKPPFRYIAAKGDEYSFTPLGSWRKMTLNEILEKHEKGLKYGHLLTDKPMYPLILDSRGEVLSFPPIINSALTELTSGTKNLFIDVTGLDLDALQKTLNILTTALHDMGGRIEQVKIIYPGKSMATPNYKTKKWRINVEYVNSLLGLNLSPLEIAKALRRMRHGVKISGKTIIVTPPPYRVDIMHTVDFVEDVAMGLGYDSLEPRQPQVLTYGKYHPATKIEELVREVMLGLGYTEVMNFTLTNAVDEYEKMAVKHALHVKLLNPVSSDYTIMRTWILPSLMKTLSHNRGSLYPQKIFEIGDVIEPDPSLPERAARKMRLGCVSCHAEASYSEIKSICEEILRNLSIGEWKLKPYDQPPFIEGRAAKIIVNSAEVGILGEINPQVLENWEITFPVAALELYIHEIMHFMIGNKEH